MELLLAARKVHLYFGLFITPALLFFALSGALQSVGLHEANSDHPNYKPARWMVVLAQIHKKQTSVVPIRRPPPGGSARPAAPPAPPAPAAATTPPPAAPRHNPWPLRVFFVLVCVGLFTSTVTGLYMSYRYNRSRVLVSLTLAAGVVVPLILLYVL